MPEKVFMARDRRRDHSFVIPDPSLIANAPVPNPCESCHSERNSAWVAEQLSAWAGDEPRANERAELAAAVLAARARRIGPEEVLLRCLASCETPVWQATAAKLLYPYATGPAVVQALVEAATSANDLVRAAAVWSLAESEALSTESRAALARALSDPLRAVRLSAAWGLRPSRSALSSDGQMRLEQATEELERSLLSQADYAESHHSLGLLYEARGAPERARDAYDQALRLAPGSVPARFNKAMLLVRSGRTEEATRELERVIELEPTLASAQFSLGLLYGEQEEWRAAVSAFTECVKIDPYYPEALHNLAHAYLGLDEAELANRVLEAALTHPRARAEALRTLVSVNVETGDSERARRWAKVAAEEIPGFGDVETIKELLRKP
jgi:tetratricopeptide (TPR) repeat protein